MAVELRASLGKLSGDPQQDVKVMYNYVMQLTEELRYAINNIGISNLNDKELIRYENGRFQVYAEEVRVKTNALRLEFGTMEENLRDALSDMEADLYGEIEASAEGLRVAFAEDIKSLDDEIGVVAVKVTELAVSADNFKVSVTEQFGAVGCSLENLGNDIDGVSNDLGLKYSELKGLITVEAGKIDLIVQGIGRDGTVDAASIMAAINADGSEVRISADKIQFEGEASFVTLGQLTDGETVISGDNILSGEIRAINYVAVGSSSGKIGTAFIVEDWVKNTVGYIGYQYVRGDVVKGASGETITSHEDKLWLRTIPLIAEDYPYNPSVKIQAAGGVSIQSEDGHGVFIYDGSGVEWMFKGGNLYKAGVVVL